MNNDQDPSTAHAAANQSQGSEDRRKLVRKAERDPWNRLMSIQQDAEWVTSFCANNVANLPIVPNLRCGAWYVPPDLVTVQGRGCYFKSTDGHTNEWGFSRKRYNPNVLALIQQHSGCVIVDSTRRGKSMPDALSKTVPIWCAVINAASRELYEEDEKECQGIASQHEALRLPKHVVSPSEEAQIRRRIDGWVDDLLDSDLDVPRLAKPLKPIFVTRSYIDDELDRIKQQNIDYYPVVLVSASPMVATPNALPQEHEFKGTSHTQQNELVLRLQRKAKFVYVQGSGDDEEMWSGKLTPGMMWNANNLCAILQTDGDSEALTSCIQTMLLESKLASVTLGQGEGNVEGSDKCIAPAFNIWFGLRPQTYTPNKSELSKYSLIVHCDGIEPDPADEQGTLEYGDDRAKHVMHLGIESGKRGLHAFRRWIPDVVAAAQTALPGAILLCSTEGDGIGHDLNAGFAVCLLATCFDAHKEPLPLEALRSSKAHPLTASAYIPPSLTKDDVQKRLQWISTFVPSAKPPSRRHMLRINEALLSQPILDKKIRFNSE